MKKHMIKETNDMRRLMGLELLKEDFEETGVMGVDAPESAGALDKDEEDHGDVVNEDDVVGVDAPESKDELKKDEKDHGDVVNEATMEDKDSYCQNEFGKDYADCTDKQKEQCDENCGKAMNEDSEGEETYNYGEDEGADHKKEEHLEDEEKMAPHDRIKAIEDHLDALKKDMDYDEDHEDREEEGTHFAEGKRY